MEDDLRPIRMQHNDANEPTLRKVIPIVLQQIKVKAMHFQQLGQEYLILYPALRTFLYSFSILSSVPLCVFAVAVCTSMCVSVVVAVLSVLFVQSSFIFIALGCLIPVEVGILLLSGALSGAIELRRNLLLKESGDNILKIKEVRDEVNLVDDSMGSAEYQK